MEVTKSFKAREVAGSLNNRGVFGCSMILCFGAFYVYIYIYIYLSIYIYFKCTYIVFFFGYTCMLHLQKEGSGTFEDFELETDFISTQLQG